MTRSPHDSRSTPASHSRSASLTSRTVNSESIPRVIPGTLPAMRVFEPASGVLAFYDGRIDGLRLHSPDPNWLDDGGFTLGIASFAIVEGGDALVYDTHLSPDH